MEEAIEKYYNYKILNNKNYTYHEANIYITKMIIDIENIGTKNITLNEYDNEPNRNTQDVINKETVQHEIQSNLENLNEKQVFHKTSCSII
jgi:hypothetical protein